MSSIKKEEPFNEQKVKDCIWQLNNSIGKPHADYTMERHIADGLFEILKLPIWHFFKAKKLEWKMAKAMNRHWDCCEIKYED